MPYKNSICRILIVDDDLDDQLLIKSYLRELTDYKFELETADSYELGAQLIGEARHDLYLVDYFLDAHTGLELITSGVNAGNKKPFILLTGVDNKEVDIKAIKAGAYDYLPKATLNNVLIERTIRHSLERYHQKMLAASSERKFRSLFTHSIDPIFFADADFRFTEVNPSFLKLFQFTPLEINGMRIEELFKSSAAFNGLKTGMDSKGFVDNFVVRLETKSGESINVLISMAPFSEPESEIEGYQGIMHDMTQLKQAEKQVLAAEKLSLSGRIARMMGHEVRNPLTNINLALDQLQEEMPAQNDEARLYVDMIKRNSDRISKMIDQLLLGTRIKELERSHHDMDAIIRKALSFCSDRFNLQNITVDYSPAKEEYPAYVDEEQLRIAIINIMTNAVEAMAETDDGQLKVDLTPKGFFYRITISDNGCGMDEDTLKHLFDAFFTDKNEGMGLGMTSVNNTVVSHGGKIEVESQPNKGTTFQLYIPM